MGLDPSAADGKMVWQKFTPKEWEESDVDIKVSHCGICGSDEHSLKSSWEWVSLRPPDFSLLGPKSNLESSSQRNILAAPDTKLSEQSCELDPKSKIASRLANE